MAAAAGKKSRRDIARTARDIEQEHVAARRKFIHECAFPDPMNAERHQVIHKVVARRDRGKHALHHRRLVRRRNTAKAELTRGVVDHVVWSLHGGDDSLRRVRLLESQVMPELPEVETVCRGLKPDLEGRVLTSVTPRRLDLRFPLPADFADRLVGRSVIGIQRRAKFILVRLDDASSLVIHLGMSGRLVVHNTAPPPAGPHDHVDFVTDAGATVRFNDVRRFGFMDLIKDDDLSRHPMFAKLGPEPLSCDFSAEILGASLAGRRTPIKSALLDQHVVAGLGNIYACEALFRANISPKRNAQTVPGKRAERLVDAIRAVLSEAIAAGGSSLRDYVQASGELGYFQHQFNAYDQEGKLCVKLGCDGSIRRISQGGRSTFYCPKHQR